jgi:ketosteroid isomerase-like protein
MRIARLFLTASAVLAVSSPAVGAQVRGTVAAHAAEEARLRSAVEAAGTRAATSYNRGDIAGFIHAYADDVWIFPPNDQPFQGPNAALDYFRRSYDRGFRNFQITTTGLDRQGSMAYETGVYSGEFPTPGQPGAMTRDNGKYVQIWKRNANGEWRTHFVMWSSNNPPPPAPR